MKRVIFILFLISCSTQTWAGEYNKVGTAVAQFLKIEAGARATAMGGSFAAIANDPSALYWNVAGIAQIDGIQACFSHNNWITGFSHDFAAAVVPVGKLGNIGVSATTLNMDEIEQTTTQNPTGTGIMIGASDIAIGLSYARFMTDYVSVGITGKYIQQNMWELSASTVALDVGFLLNTGFKGITLGMTLSNFGPELTLGGRNLVRGLDKWPENHADPNVQTSLMTSGWPLPTSYRVALAIRLIGSHSPMFVKSNLNTLTMALDALHLNDNPEHYSIGVEYSLKNWLFARAGYKSKTDEQGLTLGGGIKLPIGANALLLDYSYSDFGVFDFVQQFSISIAF